MKKLILIFCLLMAFIPIQVSAEDENLTYIIEVKGDPSKHATMIKRQYPTLEIVETFTILLQALAVKGAPKDMNQLLAESFVENVHEVGHYQATAKVTSLTDLPKGAVFPQALNTTKFTGKGVKLAVVDTGIDLAHPDLRDNIKGGYDVVDFKKDPQETVGLGATNHGSHVAGIIAANGKIKGLAPEADLYAYRALGPGGFGTSVHVIAAMEKAIQDDVAIMNLSLGNIINGPDYPTSKAVNKAIELGVIVVVANGNDGPAEWTVGAPATASQALSVGAYQGAGTSPYLENFSEKKKIKLTPLTKSNFWLTEKRLAFAANIKQGKVYIMKEEDKSDENFLQLVTEKAEALLLPNELLDETLLETSQALDLPVAIVKTKDLAFLKMDSFHDLKLQANKATIAPFSSRGPVTVNWQIKPDIIAPGVDIVSTVPGGYQMMKGTSMAAPHVAGALAVMKEARPDWSNEQLVHALKTTARRLDNIRPIEQGAGLIDIEKAINTTSIIHDGLLNFGKLQKGTSEKTVQITIENMGTRPASYTIQTPKKIPGIRWELAKPVTIAAGAKKSMEVTVKITPHLLSKGLHQGYIQVDSQDEAFSLPYMFIHETADYPRVMGTQFQVQSLQNDEFSYEMYLTEIAEEVKIQFLNRETLTINETIFLTDEFSLGMNEGRFEKHYRDNEIALLTIRFTNGNISQTYVEL